VSILGRHVSEDHFEDVLQIHGANFAFATAADAAACGGFAPSPAAQPVIPANMVKLINLYPNCDIGLPACPTTNNYFLYFFVLTGLHAFHVLIGMGILIALVRLSGKPSLSEGQFSFVEGGACFWHMVDLIWVVLFALLYLMH